jgi:hypothetical protein
MNTRADALTGLPEGEARSRPTQNYSEADFLSPYCEAG